MLKFKDFKKPVIEIYDVYLAYRDAKLADSEAGAKTTKEEWNEILDTFSKTGLTAREIRTSTVPFYSGVVPRTYGHHPGTTIGLDFIGGFAPSTTVQIPLVGLPNQTPGSRYPAPAVRTLRESRTASRVGRNAVEAVSRGAASASSLADPHPCIVKLRSCEAQAPRALVSCVRISKSVPCQNQVMIWLFGCSILWSGVEMLMPIFPEA